MRDTYFAHFVLSVCICPSPHPPKGKAHAEAPLSAAFRASRGKTNNNYYIQQRHVSFICMFICISVFRHNFTCFSLMIQGIRPRRSVPRIEIALGICISWVSILKKCQFSIAVGIESSSSMIHVKMINLSCFIFHLKITESKEIMTIFKSKKKGCQGKPYYSPGNLAQKWAFQKTNCNRIFFATMHFSEVPRPTY